ncbi:hypothetical protein AB0323_11765 [Arthrobacter sp. NPDC080031]
MDKFRARGITGPAHSAKRMIQQNPTAAAQTPVGYSPAAVSSLGTSA